MIESYITCPRLIRAAQALPATDLQAFLSYLEHKRYSPKTICFYLNSVIHLSYWQRSIAAIELDTADTKLRAHFYAHLVNCSCPKLFTKTRHVVKAALVHWDLITRSCESSPPQSEIEKLVWEFDGFMGSEAGLSSATRIYRRRYAREFLDWIDTGHGLNFANITNKTLPNYLGVRACSVSLPTIAIITTSIRCFLKFLSATERHYGAIDIGILTPKLSITIPETQALSVSELEHFLNVINRSYSVGKRDYAMARCLIDLGMRTSDVAQLTLDSIDWRHKILTFGPGKSRHYRRLPIPDILLDALADYLQHARPKTAVRTLFVYHRAPVGEPVLPSTVRGAMRRVFKRAGFTTQDSQVHRLRHSMATRLMDSGAPLKSIADVLGHISLDTTTRYTYIHRSSLVQVALPWPGRTL